MNSANAAGFVEHNEDLCSRDPIPGLDVQPIVPLAEAGSGVVDDYFISATFLSARATCDGVGLSVDEAAAAILCVMDIGGQSVRKDVNKALRANNRKELLRWVPYLKLLESALAKLPQSEVGGTLWRVARGNFEAPYRARMGQEVVWAGLTCVCLNLPQVDKLIGEEEWTVFDIKGRGAIATELLRFLAGGVVVLPARSVFRVLWVGRSGAKETTVRLALVEGGGTLEETETEAKRLCSQVRKRHVETQCCNSHNGEQGQPLREAVCGPLVNREVEHYLEALRRNVCDVVAYRGLCKLLSRPDRVKLVQSKREELLDIVACNSNDSFAYFLLGLPLDGADVITLRDGRRMGARALFLHAVRCNSDNSDAYNGLATTLAEEEDVELADGRRLDARALFLLSIKCDVLNERAYFNLGTCLRPGEKIELADGRRMGEQALYMEAIRCDVNYSMAYNNLAGTVSDGDEVELADGRRMDARRLYVEAIRCDISNAHGYHNLATKLVEGEDVELADGRRMDQRCLFIEAIKCDVNFATAYNNLASLLEQAEVIELRDGRRMDERRLYLEAIRCNIGYAMTYNNLAATLAEGEVVELADGRRMTQRRLYLHAIGIDPTSDICWDNLATTAEGPEEQVQVLDGRKMTAAELRAEAARLRDARARAEE